MLWVHAATDCELDALDMGFRAGGVVPEEDDEPVLGILW
jgi:hypothetical protein